MKDKRLQLVLDGVERAWAKAKDKVLVRDPFPVAALRHHVEMAQTSRSEDLAMKIHKTPITGHHLTSHSQSADARLIVLRPRATKNFDLPENGCSSGAASEGVLSLAVDWRSNCSNDERPQQRAVHDDWRMKQCICGLVSLGIGDDQAEGVSQDGIVILQTCQVMATIPSHKWAQLVEFQANHNPACGTANFIDLSHKGNILTPFWSP